MIAKRPDLPEKFKDLIAEFTEVCFLPDQKQQVDIVFAFGTTLDYQLLIDHLANLYSSGISNNYLISGCAAKTAFPIKEGETEAELIYKGLPQQMRKNANIILEKESTNTSENVEYSLPYLEPYKDKKIGCVARSWAGRQMYHFKRFLPDSNIVFLPFEGLRNDGVSFNAANWHENEDACQRIWGEVMRFKEYGEKGFMAYPDELRLKIDNIFSKINP